MCPQADGVGEQQLSAIIRKFSINRSTHQAKASGQQLKEIGPQADERSEREFSRIERELKEIGSQADFKGERELTRINRELSIDSGAHQAKASNRELKEIGPQADGVGEQQLSAIRQQFLIIYANRLFTMND